MAERVTTWSVLLGGCVGRLRWPRRIRDVPLPWRKTFANRPPDRMRIFHNAGCRMSSSRYFCPNRPCPICRSYVDNDLGWPSRAGRSAARGRGGAGAATLKLPARATQGSAGYYDQTETGGLGFDLHLPGALSLRSTYQRTALGEDRSRRPDDCARIARVRSTSERRIRERSRDHWQKGWPQLDPPRLCGGSSSAANNASRGRQTWRRGF